LAGLSFLLSAPGGSGAETLDRCRIEVDSALQELREALCSVAGPAEREIHGDIRAELRAMRRENPGAISRAAVEVVLERDPRSVVASFVLEALRNIRKHSSPSEVRVEMVEDLDVVLVSVVNDGVRSSRGPSCGAGRRLLEVEASLHGGLIESTVLDDGRWLQRLLLPAS
jgi:signal transduction histidine kinase